MVTAKDNRDEAGVHQSDIEWDPSVSQKLFNANDGLTGRDGGPYLDEVEMRDAEKRRAAVENRKPDLENPGPTAGTYLVPGSYLLAQNNVPNIPSQDDKDVVGAALSKHVDGKDFLPKSYGEVPTQKELDELVAEARENLVESPLPSDSQSKPVPVDEDPHNGKGTNDNEKVENF